MAEAFGYSKIDLYESKCLLGIYSKSEEHSGSFTSQTSDSLPHPLRSSLFHSKCINTGGRQPGPNGCEHRKRKSATLWLKIGHITFSTNYWRQHLNNKSQKYSQTYTYTYVNFTDNI